MYNLDEVTTNDISYPPQILAIDSYCTINQLKYLGGSFLCLAVQQAWSIGCSVGKKKTMIETFNPRFQKFGTVSLRICGVKIFIYAGICRRVVLFLVDVGRDIVSSIDALWMVKMGLLAALIGSLPCLSNNYRLVIKHINGTSTIESGFPIQPPFFQFSITMWGWVKTLVPGEPQNSW